MKFFPKQTNNDATIQDADEQGQISTAVSPSLSTLSTPHISSSSSVSASVCTSSIVNSITDQLSSMS